jgi:hypothetical protein
MISTHEYSNEKIVSKLSICHLKVDEVKVSEKIMFEALVNAQANKVKVLLT